MPVLHRGHGVQPDLPPPEVPRDLGGTRNFWAVTSWLSWGRCFLNAQGGSLLFTIFENQFQNNNNQNNMGGFLAPASAGQTSAGTWSRAR